jgi:TrmH family RNA methyltransferase
VERFAVTDSGLPGIEVEPAVLDRFSELGSGTRTLAIYEQRWQTLDEIDPTLNHEIDPTLNRAIDPTLNRAIGPTPHQIEPRAVCVYLHGLSDPGNVGTILRSAAAFGVGCVAFGPGTADPFGPKAVRASMGAIFTVPVLRAPTTDLPGVKLALDAKAPATLVETVAHLDSSVPVTLMIGAERDGLPADVLQTADHVAAIPILTESLNAAIAAGIALYELSQHVGSDRP